MYQCSCTTIYSYC